YRKQAISKSIQFQQFISEPLVIGEDTMEVSMRFLQFPRVPYWLLLYSVIEPEKRGVQLRLGAKGRTIPTEYLPSDGRIDIVDNGGLNLEKQPRQHDLRHRGIDPGSRPPEMQRCHGFR